MKFKINPQFDDVSHPFPSISNFTKFSLKFEINPRSMNDPHPWRVFKISPGLKYRANLSTDPI